MIGSNDIRTYPWTRGVWLHLSRQLELALLDRRYTRRFYVAALLVFPRDIWARDPQEARAATAQGDRRRKYRSAAGARKDGFKSHRHSRAFTAPEDDMLRAARAFHVLVLELRL